MRGRQLPMRDRDRELSRDKSRRNGQTQRQSEAKIKVHGNFGLFASAAILHWVVSETMRWRNICGGGESTSRHYRGGCVTGVAVICVRGGDETINGLG